VLLQQNRSQNEQSAMMLLSTKNVQKIVSRAEQLYTQCSNEDAYKLARKVRFRLTTLLMIRADKTCLGVLSGSL
jgi:hypothetical protein